MGLGRSSYRAFVILDVEVVALGEEESDSEEESVPRKW